MWQWPIQRADWRSARRRSSTVSPLRALVELAEATHPSTPVSIQIPIDLNNIAKTRQADRQEIGQEKEGDLGCLIRLGSQPGQASSVVSAIDRKPKLGFFVRE